MPNVAVRTGHPANATTRARTGSGPRPTAGDPVLTDGGRLRVGNRDDGTTIHELAPGSFPVVRPLFEAVWFDEAQIGAALERKQAGRVFVDDPDRPRAALVCRTYGFYPAGDPANAALRAFIADAPAEAAVFDRLYGYMVDAPWRDALLRDQGEALTTIDRRAFHFPAAAPTPPVVPPPGASVVAIDAPLAERIDRELGQLIGLFWGDHGRFGEGGVGACTLVDGRVASVAYAIAVSDRTANIDVETVHPYRRRGLAALTSAAFVAACRWRGLTPTWGCDAINPASAALAAKLGFVEDPPHFQLSPADGAAKVGSRGRWTTAVGDERVALVYRRT